MCIRDSYRTQADPYLETREREELFVKQIVDAVENILKQALSLFLSGMTAGIDVYKRQLSYQLKIILCYFSPNYHSFLSAFRIYLI